MRRITIVCLLALVGFGACAFEKIGAIFQVDTRDPAHFPSSCLRRLDPEDPNSYLYDPRAEPRDRTHLLNKIWFWTYYMASVAHLNTRKETYDSNFDTRKLLWSFFGIQQFPRQTPQGTIEFEPDPDSFDGRKLRQLRSWLRHVTDFMDQEHPDGPGKPKLFCDSTWTAWQTGNEPALNRQGQPLRRRNGNVYTLREWERKHRRNFDDNWYYWMAFGGDIGYLVYPKPDRSQRQPHPNHPLTGKPSYCAEEHKMAWTWHEGSLPRDESGGGTDAWIRHNIVTICPATFEDDDNDDADFTQQPIGTHLDEMSMKAITLYHELVHVTHYAPDHKPWFPAWLDPRRGRLHPDYPTKKSGFDRRRWERADQDNLWGALQSLTLARYELAEPAATLLNEVRSLRDPETIAWFTFTLMTQLATGQDWSTGAARPGNSPPQEVTATIPEMFPPQAKVGPMTRPFSNASLDDVWPYDQEDDESITSGWMNTTEKMGPITLFDEFSTLMTSFRRSS